MRGRTASLSNTAKSRKRQFNNVAQEIKNPTYKWNPESQFHLQRLESST